MLGAEWRGEGDEGIDDDIDDAIELLLLVLDIERKEPEGVLLFSSVGVCEMGDGSRSL